MESKRIALFDELIRKNSDAYIKLLDGDVLIYSKFLDFEYIRTSMYYHRCGKMKFKMMNDLPILLDIKDINKNIFDILYNQLLTGLTSSFGSVGEQIGYIILLEQLSGGNEIEIKDMVKSIKFDINTYILLTEYGFNVLNYMNKNITINQIILGFLSEHKLLIRNDYAPLCKFGLKCKSHFIEDYHCKWKHDPIIITNKIETCLRFGLPKYNVVYLGKKEDFYNPDHSTHNYDCKILSSDNTIYDIIFENGFAFAFNPQNFVDRDKYQYSDKDQYAEEIFILINDKLVKCRYVALFKPYNCCSKSIYYHCHGN